MADQTVDAPFRSRPVGVKPKQALVSSTDASTPVELVPAVANQTAVISDMLISFGAALTATIEDTTDGGGEMVRIYGAASTTVRVPGRIAATAANRALDIQTSGAGNVAVTYWYHYETDGAVGAVGPY